MEVDEPMKVDKPIDETYTFMHVAETAGRKRDTPEGVSKSSIIKNNRFRF